MFQRCLSFLLSGVMVLTLPGLTACGQEIVAQAGVAPVATATDQAQTNDLGLVVQTTPLPDAELALQPPGQSEPGAAATGGPGEPAPVTLSPQPLLGASIMYVDSTDLFSVAYPEDFVFHTLPPDKLAPLVPRPDASFTFMNPGTAASDTPELEPADLEIRVYRVAQQPATLQDWLTAHGLLPADGSVRPRTAQKGALSVLEVCASTMLAPGCSYFVAGTSRVYQLIAVTLAGETMVESFRQNS